VVDIGCGDGRDSYAFAGAGRSKVTGLDRSHVGVRQAAKKAEQLGYGDTLTFTACDVGNADKLRATLESARDGDEPMLFYARFFLHSIPEDVQRTLMTVVAECARPGDHFAAEFRTDRDEASAKVHGNHYRRFQNGPAFGRSLRETYGFTPLLEQEGNGFSPYQGEDPQLYRVIARRG
jgi:SAM-dependent methyltransferase